MAGTPILTPRGDKAIEELVPGDLVVSRSEHSELRSLEFSRVEKVFKHSDARILDLRVRGQLIRATTEHPFYVVGKGWVACSKLNSGDRLVGTDGHETMVEEVIDNGEFESVYNLRVAENHTYFVGSKSWGFDIWVHNLSAIIGVNVPT